MKTAAGLMSQLKCTIRDNGGNVNSADVLRCIKEFEYGIRSDHEKILKSRYLRVFSEDKDNIKNIFIGD